MLETSVTTQPQTTASTFSAPAERSTDTSTARWRSSTSTTKTENTTLVELISNQEPPAPAVMPKGLSEMFEGLTKLISQVVDLISQFLKAREKDENKAPPTPTTPPVGNGQGGNGTTPPPTGGSSGAPGAGQTTPPPTGNNTTPPGGSECKCPDNGNGSGSGSSGSGSATGTGQTKTPKEVGASLRPSGQFLWKPVSEKDGKLAVLIPASISDQVQEVAILSPDKTKVLQKGRFSGIGNGDRAHFRFSKPGGQFPDGAIVWIKLKDGTSRHVVIKNTESRVTR